MNTEMYIRLLEEKVKELEAKAAKVNEVLKEVITMEALPGCHVGIPAYQYNKLVKLIDRGEVSQ